MLVWACTCLYSTCFTGCCRSGTLKHHPGVSTSACGSPRFKQMEVGGTNRVKSEAMLMQSYSFRISCVQINCLPCQFRHCAWTRHHKQKPCCLSTQNHIDDNTVPTQTVLTLVKCSRKPPPSRKLICIISSLPAMHSPKHRPYTSNNVLPSSHYLTTSFLFPSRLALNFFLKPNPSIFKPGRWAYLSPAR